MEVFFRLIDTTDERRAVAEANRQTEAIERENIELRRRLADLEKEATRREIAELRRRIAALEQRHNDQDNP